MRSPQLKIPAPARFLSSSTSGLAGQRLSWLSHQLSTGLPRDPANNCRRGGEGRLTRAVLQPRRDNAVTGTAGTLCLRHAVSLKLSVVERYYQELLNFLSRQVRDREAAADLVQETYARAAAVQCGGQAISEPRAFLYRTARNLIVDRHRRREVRGENPPEEPTPLAPADAMPAPQAFEPETAFSAARNAQAMLDTIAALPLRCREAFILHKFDGLPQAEVAVRMGISVKMVERHIKLALKACLDCRRQWSGDSGPDA